MVPLRRRQIMRKTYSKPEIVFEGFTLSTNIAGDCEEKTHTPAARQCAVDFSGLSLFLDGMGACADIKVENLGGDGEFNSICYHVFTDGSRNFFNS
jgi:hypothetical protein